MRTAPQSSASVLCVGHHGRLAVRGKLRPPDEVRLFLDGIHGQLETSLFLAGFAIPDSHHARATIDGNNLLAVARECQVFGSSFETGKAFHIPVGNDVVQADARAGVTRLRIARKLEPDALSIDGPGEKPAVGAHRQAALPGDS